MAGRGEKQMIPYVNATNLPMPAGRGVNPGSGPENEGAAFPDFLSAVMAAENRPTTGPAPRAVNEKAISDNGPSSHEKALEKPIDRKAAAETSQNPEKAKQQTAEEVTENQDKKAAKMSGEAKDANSSVEQSSVAKTEKEAAAGRETAEKNSQSNGAPNQSGSEDGKLISAQIRSTVSEEGMLKTINAEKGDANALKQPQSQMELQAARHFDNGDVKTFTNSGNQLQNETTVPKLTEMPANTGREMDNKSIGASELIAKQSQSTETQIPQTEMKKLKGELLTESMPKQMTGNENLKEQPALKITAESENLRNQTPDQNRMNNTTENRSFQQMQQNASVGLSETENRGGSEKTNPAVPTAEKNEPQSLNQNPLLRENTAKQLAETLLVRDAAGKMKTVVSAQPQPEADANNGEKQIRLEKDEPVKVSISRNAVMAAMSSANREINAARPEENISRQINAKDTQSETPKTIEAQTGANSGNSENGNQESAYSQGKNAAQNPFTDMNGKIIPIMSDKMDTTAIFGNRFASQVHEMEQTTRTSMVERITQSIVTAAASRITHARLTFNAQELGQIQIRYEENSANIQKVTLLMESESAKQIIQKQIPQILENMQSKGVFLENIETRVNDGRDNAFAEKRFYDRQQNQGRRTQSNPFQKSAENPISEQVVIRQFGYNTIEYTA
jgi:hypothetical protein